MKSDPSRPQRNPKPFSYLGPGKSPFKDDCITNTKTPGLTEMTMTIGCIHIHLLVQNQNHLYLMGQKILTDIPVQNTGRFARVEL
mmetsp:Transcript_7838/g.14454  ORF Transcript_7838/g.14454 Transcript_7838/m.14454 type:complete len:85 (-) Transcript_7838:7-261(-)